MIRIQVKDRGLKEAQRALKELEKVCSGASGPNTVSINSRTRKDGSPEKNTKILERLTRTHADFVSLTNQADEHRVFQPIADEVVRRMQIALSPQGAGIDNMKEAEIRGAALMKGMKAYLALVTERFEQQRPAKGTLKHVSEDYARQRLAATGVAEDVVGINTSDLLDNIASGDIRLSRK